MKRFMLTVTLFVCAGAPCAYAQFGSGIVFDPTQSGHAIVQIEHEEQSLANEARRSRTANRSSPTPSRSPQRRLQTYNTVKQQYDLYRQMMLAPRCFTQRFLSPQSDLMLMQQVSNTYGNSMGWLNASNTGTGAAASYQQASRSTHSRMIPGYGTTSAPGQQQIAAQGATIDIGDSVMSTNLQVLGTIRANQVARQTDIANLETASQSQDPSQQTDHGNASAHQSGPAIATAYPAGCQPDQRQPCPATDGCPEAATGRIESWISGRRQLQQHLPGSGCPCL